MRRRKKAKPTAKKWLWQFSKVILCSLTILYIIERLFTMVVIIMQGQSLDAFLTTGTEVFLAAVVSYAVKSAVENVFKIKGTKEEGTNDDSHTEC